MPNERPFHARKGQRRAVVTLTHASSSHGHVRLPANSGVMSVEPTFGPRTIASAPRTSLLTLTF
jgi:hypothetical protein